MNHFKILLLACTVKSRPAMRTAMTVTRIEASSEPGSPEPAPGLPPAVTTPPPPHLSASVPDSVTTPEGQWLYLLAHDRPGSGLRAPPISVGTGRLMAGPNGTVMLGTLRLNNRHADLARLLDGADAHRPRGAGSTYDAVTTAKSVDGWLALAVERHYADPAFDGGGSAANRRGGNTFTYATTPQVLVTADPKTVGLECLASAAFHQYKAMGLIPPGLTRPQVEARYTSIHGVDGTASPRLGHDYDLAVRGFPTTAPARAFTPLEVVAFANALRQDDWAKLTGAASGSYGFRALPSISAVVAHLSQGGAAVNTSWANGGHHFVLTGAKASADGSITVNEDDSLRTSTATRGSAAEWPYQTRYDPSSHSHFWALVR